MTEEIIKIKKCEVKRALEKLSKIELSLVLEMSYHHYCNVLNGSDTMSKKMHDKIDQYLTMTQEEVWAKLMRNRVLKKEKHNSFLEIDSEFIANTVKELDKHNLVDKENGNQQYVAYV